MLDLQGLLGLLLPPAASHQPGGNLHKRLYNEWSIPILDPTIQQRRVILSPHDRNTRKNRSPDFRHLSRRGVYFWIEKSRHTHTGLLIYSGGNLER